MFVPARVFRRPGSPIGAPILTPILAAVFCALLASGLSATAHARGGKPKTGGSRVKKVAPRAKSPKVVPNQEGKIVVFPFKDDDDNSIAAQVERLLKGHGLEVVTGVRPVDTAEQYREMAGTMGLAAYLEGSLKEGESKAKVTIQLRSGYTGKRVAAMTVSETKLHLRAEIEDKLWTKLGPAMARACADATKPRKRGRGPLMIEAGTPLAASETSSNQ
jgi:hypothetical protein